MDIKSAEAELSALQIKATTLVSAAKAARRELTDAEMSSLEADRDRAIQLKAQIVGMKSAAVTAQIGTDHPSFEGVDGTTHFGSAAMKGFVTARSLKSMVTATAPQAAKALVAGGVATTAVELDTDPIQLGRPSANLGILDVVPLVQRDTPTYSYLRQSVRTNNAAEVASGAQKPTSVLTVERVDSSLKVVAHLSEYVDTYLLEDNSNLESFIEVELRNGIFDKVTANAVVAFNGTSGIQTQAFSGSALDSIILGAGKVSSLGYNPDVVLISRGTLETIFLAKSTTGEYLANGPGGAAGGLQGNVFGSLRPVVATGLPANSALVLDSSKVQISTDRQGIKTKWDAISKMDYNQARALVEGRFAYDVLAAPAIVRVSTVAP